ncbi:MAG TPA: Na+/H+ antiporter subunit E [Ilumatobacteraceae bacterium]
MKLIVHGAGLIGLWCLLWGDLSVANVISGGAVAALLMVAYPTGVRPTHGMSGVRPVALVRLVVYVLYEFAVSNALVARAVLSRESKMRTGIVACPLRTTSESMITFLANVLALSPGTLPVEVSLDPPVIHLHVLLLRDDADPRRNVALLESLALRAFGNRDDLARLDRSEREPGPGRGRGRARGRGSDDGPGSGSGDDSGARR